MGKYIIDIDKKNVCSDDDGSQLAITVKINDASAIFCTEIPLTPYTELDLDQVRKEAYEQGRKDGKIEGRAEVWVVARDIDHMSDDDIKACFECGFSGVFEKYTASEAIEKLKAYEQEKEELIQIGDEVTIRDKTAVVTEITDRYVRIMYSDGSCYALFSKGIVKTGRHFPEIAEVLRKMKEADNG